MNSPNDTLQALMDLTIEFRNQRNWQPWNTPKNQAISLALEAAEVLDHFKWYPDNELIAQFAKNNEDVGDELMDVLYNVFVICHDLQIDIPTAYQRKMHKNAIKYPIATKSLPTTTAIKDQTFSVPPRKDQN